MDNLAELPPQCKVDYNAVLSFGPDGLANAVFFLKENLPTIWRDIYVAGAMHQANLVRFRVGAFEYICDLYSELEAKGEVPINQTIEDRVVAVFGISSHADETRDPTRMRGWLGATDEVLGMERDKGHF